jgi:hypothetical protein
MVRVNPPVGSALVASSGSRLVLSRSTVFNFVTGAGTSSAAVGADQVVLPPVVPMATPRFAQGPDGVVLMTNSINGDGPAPDCNCTAREHLAWLLPNALTSTIDNGVSTDVESYATMQILGGLCHQCMPTYIVLPSLATWVDAKTALVAAPESGPTANQAIPAIRVVTRDPVAYPSKRRFVPDQAETPAGNFAVERIALTSSNGFGYLLVANAQGNDIHISIFDPRCEAQ